MPIDVRLAFRVLSSTSVLAVCLTGCDADESADPGEALSQSAATLPVSPTARRIVADVRADFVIQPPDSGLPGPTEPSPVLAASASSELEDDGEAVIPRLPLGAAPSGVAVRLPRTADDAIRLVHEESSLAVDVRLRDVAPVAAEAADATLVYPAALAGSDVIVRTTETGVEDYVHFAARPGEEALTYDIELGDHVAGLRLVADTLELLDVEGVPRLRMAPPYAVDRAGVVRPLRVEVAGCAVDTDPVPSAGRAFTRLDHRSCEVRIDWADASLSYPLLVDPSWGSTNVMASARMVHTASTLPSGKVLVAGGFGGGYLASAEIWDPATGVWTATGSLTTGRYYHAMSPIASGATTLLVVSGGFNPACPGSICSAAERYDVATGVWSAAGTTTARFGHASSTLTTASPRVLVTGGASSGGVVLSTAELYDPVSNTWTATSGLMQHPRYGHTSTALSSGSSSKVILVGGFDAAGAIAPVGETERYMPAEQRFYEGPRTESRVAFHTSTLVPGSDLILIAGGQVDNLGNCTRVTGRYFGPTDSYAALQLLTTARCNAAASVLDSNKVIVTGGRSTTSTAELSTAELYDWGTNTWTTSFMPAARAFHTASLYPSAPAGKVLVPGGSFGMGSGALASTDIYTP